MAQPNGHFDLNADGADFGDGSLFGDLAREESDKDTGSLFALSSAGKILGSRFSASQSDELVAINADNPQRGITEFAELINSRLDALIGQVRGSQDRIVVLLEDLVADPSHIADEDLLLAIEEFVEVSKYALVTYEALQVKVDRVLPDHVVVNNKELDDLRSDLSRVIYDHRKERTVRHEELVQLIGSAAKQDEQLTALVAEVYQDLGVQGDDDFNETWLNHSGRKTFCTLPDTQIEFLKRFDKILESIKEESRRSTLFAKTYWDEDFRNPDQVDFLHTKSVPLKLRFRELKDNAIDRIRDTFYSQSARISNWFAAKKFSLKKIGAVLTAIGVTTAGAAFGANQLGSDADKVESVDKTEQTSDTVISDPAPTQESPQVSEPLNPHTGKPFTELEGKFLAWVEQQMSMGRTEADITEMMTNLVTSMNVEQPSAEIVAPAVETNQKFQSRRTGGDSSRRAQIAARSRAAQRNQQVRQNVPAVTTPSRVSDTPAQNQPTTTVAPAPETTILTTTIPEVPDNTIFTTLPTTSTTVLATTSTTVDVVVQTQLGQLSMNSPVVSSPPGLERLSLSLR